MDKPSRTLLSAVGEALCLEFANTAESDKYHLDDYNEMVSWCQSKGVLTHEMASSLRVDALDDPGRAERAFHRAMAFRRVVYAVFAAVGGKLSPKAEDLRSLSKAAASALSHLHIAETATGFQWQWDVAKPQLELPLWIIARSAADLLTSTQRSRVRQCESADCNWLFVDRSKNRSRRWCDMAECGNREKARRSRARKQSGV